MDEWAAELYVHAIAIEREAARRYAELADAMARDGDHAAEALFRQLSAFESRHLDELRRRAAGIALPDLSADYTWHQADAPATPERALLCALAAEKRARAFFEHAERLASDPDARSLAREMASEETGHVAIVESILARRPAPVSKSRNTAGA